MARERARAIRNTPYRLRSQGKCVKQLLLQKKRLYTTSAYLILSAVGIAIPLHFRRAILVAAVFEYYVYKFNQSVVYRNRKWRWRPAPTFDNLDSLWCWHHLRFKKKHLWRISESLLLPAEHRLSNGSWTTNQEMLIVFLIRICSTDKWLKLEELSSVEYSRMSRIFSVITIQL